jgi:hypothetical protein
MNLFLTFPRKARSILDVWYIHLSLSMTMTFTKLAELHKKNASD